MTIYIFLILAATFYILSFVAATFAKRSHDTLTLVCAFAGFASQTAALGFRTFETATIPVSTSYDLLELITWVFVLIQICGAGFLKIRLVGIFSMLPAAILTILPLCCPMFAQAMRSSPKTAPNPAAAHAIIAAISYAFMVAGAIAATMYITQENRLRAKKHGGLGSAMPSLQALDRAMTTTLGAALFTMFVSAALGGIAAMQTTISGIMLLKLTTAVVILLMQAGLFIAAAKSLATGRTLAKFEIALAIAALILLIPIELRTVI